MWSVSVVNRMEEMVKMQNMAVLVICYTHIIIIFLLPLSLS